MAWKRFWEWLRRRKPPGVRPLTPVHRQGRNQRRSPEDVTYELQTYSPAGRNASPRQGALWKMLTPREQDVAALIYAGYSNAQIAYLLGLGVETVRTHIQRMLRKCGLHSRMELSNILEREGAEGIIQRRLEELLNPPAHPGERG